MKVKKSTFKDLLVSFVFGLLSVLLYYSFFEIKNGTLPLAVCAVIFRSLTMVVVLNCIGRTCDNNCFTGASFLLYSTVIYNSISSIKYSVDSLYTGAIDSFGIRIMGSLFIDFVIILSVIVFERFHKKSVMISRVKTINMTFSVPTAITLAAVVFYAVINIYYTLATGTLLSAGVSRTMRTFVNVMTYITYAITILSVRRKENGKLRLLSLTPIALIGLINLFMTMISGKKNIIIVFAVVVICGLLFTHKISFKLAKLVAFVSPLAFQCIQILSEVVSSRNFFSIQYQLQYHAFRFDLSDLAITIASKFDILYKPISILTEAISYSIPSVINPYKISELSAYKNQMSTLGLIPDFDFNDTFFSMGAQIGGYIGIVIVFVMILIFYEWISWKVINIKTIGPGILLVLVSYFGTCEADWSMFIYQTRDIFIYIFMSYILFKIVTKVRLKKQR